MKKTAIFDIDGTIFRSSLLIEITEALVQEGLFPVAARSGYAKAYKKWSDRKGSYEKYIDAVIVVYVKYIKGVSRVDFMKVAKKVGYFHKNRVYRYTRKLVKDLKNKNYFLLAISGSPYEMVEEFCRGWGFDKVYGRVFEVDKKGKFTGKVLRSDLIADKEKILKRAVKKEGLSLAGSVGVGDSETDIAFLKMVKRPVCFNPNGKLYAHAKRVGWPVVVERKDVVYNIIK
ncbi:MAG: HAD family phosphatase [Candidatus Magasanikbacteria bacterium]|nr:HAD family phosphatase [Candidatus Magasanikbacteria bacterium]